MRQHNVTGSWNNTSIISAYAESIAYDANGNITRYLRRGANTAGNPLDMDSLSYKYNWGADGKLINNQLNYVRDAVSTSNYSVDIDNQSANNYTYDHNGNLKRDVAEGIDTIRWTVYGKINRIVKNGNTLKINYGYDPGGNRTSKVVSGAADTTTFYVRDAQGNVLAIYTKRGSNALQWNEQDLYGSSRIGLWRWDTIVPAAPPIAQTGSPIQDSLMIGARNYELTNHLGNVLSTITDKKIGHDSSGVVNYYIAEVLSQNDYYPFGMMMPGRKFMVGNGYRYGFQKQEKENEVFDGALSFEFRVEDSRIGKFFSSDPLSSQYPFNSPYAFAENRTIDGTEVEGLEWQPVNRTGENVTIGSKDLYDFKWVGFGIDGKAPAGTIGSFTLVHGDNKYSYGSSFDRSTSRGTGSVTIQSVKNPSNRINAFIFGDNTAQWSQNLNGQKSFGLFSAGYYRNGELRPENVIDRDVRGFTGLDFMLQRGEQRKSLGWKPQAIETDGLGLFDYIGPGELKLLIESRAGIKALLKGGVSFEEYKLARGGTKTLNFIETTDKAGNTVMQRISTEYHHVFITQRTQRALGLPNWLVNNQVNVWRMNTIQHAILDPGRFQFLRYGLKSEVGLFNRYNLFTKFP